MKDVRPEALRAYFLWKDLDESLWQQFSRSMDWHHYSCGDEIQAAEQECLCVLWSGKIKVYDTEIPRSVRASEISKEGTSIFKHDPGGKVADAYRELTREVVKNAEKRRKRNLEQLR